MPPLQRYDIRRCAWIHRCFMENFTGIDVADTGHDPLVHQKFLHRYAPPPCSPRQPFRITDLKRIGDLAGLRSAPSDFHCGKAARIDTEQLPCTEVNAATRISRPCAMTGKPQKASRHPQVNPQRPFVSQIEPYRLPLPTNGFHGSASQVRERFDFRIEFPRSDNAFSPQCAG